MCKEMQGSVWALGTGCVCHAEALVGICSHIGQSSPGMISLLEHCVHCHHVHLSGGWIGGTPQQRNTTAKSRPYLTHQGLWFICVISIVHIRWAATIYMGPFFLKVGNSPGQLPPGIYPWVN